MKDLADAAANNGWWLAPGIVGRLMFHSKEVQAGRRRFWGREMLPETFIAVGMAMIGNALGTYWDLPGPVSAGLIGALSYLGPRFIDTAGANILERFKRRRP
ncbi:phage holin family protein [Sphingobium sp. CFD-2]|uniref:phage holin family protein n=1 Tax=Sphingobium sp. CFD-2 TaxID=2878542 RepID=UPI00214B9091|nr:phage holin family protein [Sphingobium sp. CFD-2]